MALLRNLKPGQQAKIFRSKWDGMMPDNDPQNLPENRPFAAINTRFNSGQMPIRGGERLILNNGGMKVVGLGTHKIGKGFENGGPTLYADRMYFNPNFPGGIPWRMGLFTGGTLGKFGDQIIVASQESGVSGSFGAFVGIVENITYPTMYDSQIPPETIGVSPIGALQTSGPAFQIGDEFFFLATELLGGNSWWYVIKYDGTTLTIDKAVNDGAAPVGGRFLALFRDQLLVLMTDRNGPNNLYVRSSAGVWGAPIVPGAGKPGARGTGSQCARFQNKMYILSCEDDVTGYTSEFFTLTRAGVLTRVLPATSLIDGASRVEGFVVYRRNLYMLWSHTATGGAYIAKFDGTTWTPKYIDLSAQLTYQPYLDTAPAGYDPAAHVIWPNPAKTNPSLALFSYRDSLCVMATDGLYISPKNNPSGTRTLSTVVGANFGYRGFVA